MKLGNGDSADLWFTREHGHKSYTSLLRKPGEEEHSVNFSVSCCVVMQCVTVCV